MTILLRGCNPGQLRIFRNDRLSPFRMVSGRRLQCEQSRLGFAAGKPRNHIKAAL